MALEQYVKWYRSLRVRFFVWVGIFIIITMVIMTWFNSSLFNELLTKQTQDRVESQGKTMAENITSLVDLWVTMVHATMHNVNEFSDSSIKIVAQGLIDSNKEIVAFEAFSKQTNNKYSSMSFRFTSFIDNPNFGGKKKDTIPASLQKNTLASLEKLSGTTVFQGKGRIVEQIYVPELNIPLLQIFVPFVLKNNKQEIWISLTIWPDRFFQALDNDSKTASYLLNAGGDVLLSGASDGTTKKIRAQKMVDDMIKGRWNGGLKAFVTKDKTPYLISFKQIPNYSLYVIIERSVKDEYEKNNWRLRRTIALALIVLLVAIMAIYVITGRLSRGINQLAYTALEIGKGNLKSRNAVREDDEVGLLGHSMNYMAQRLEDLLAKEVEATRQAAELKTAQAVQNTLLPRDLKFDGNLVISGHYESATECAGDWWGYFPINKDIEVLVIADATGHGASAALIVAMLFSYFRTLVSKPEAAGIFTESLDTVIKGLNDVMCSAGYGMCTLTMFIAVFNFKTKKVNFSNAGHIMPLLLSSREGDPRYSKSSKAEKTDKTDKETDKVKKVQHSKAKPLTSSGQTIGIFPEITIPVNSMDIFPGDTFFFYTDGVIETPNLKGEAIGKITLRKYLESIPGCDADSFRKNVVDYFIKHVGNAPRVDDVTIVIAKINEHWNSVETECTKA